MRKKVRKSLAFLLALALVVSVMSGLGLSVSAEEEITSPGTETVQPVEEEVKEEKKETGTEESKTDVEPTTEAVEPVAETEESKAKTEETPSVAASAANGLAASNDVAVYANERQATIKNVVQNATVAYVRYDVANIKWEWVQESKTDFDVTYSTSQSNTYSHHLFLVKPAENHLLTTFSLSSSQTGHDLYSTDSTQVSETQINTYPDLESLLKEAQSKGYVGYCGYTTGNVSWDGIVVTQTATGQKPTLGVSAKPEPSENVKPGDSVKFTVTLTPERKDEVTQIAVETLTINGKAYQVEDLKKNDDGTYTAIVYYTATNSDWVTGNITLNVDAKVDYNYSLPVKDRYGVAGNIKTKSTIENTGSTTVSLASDYGVVYELNYDAPEGVAPPSSITNAPKDINRYFEGGDVTVQEYNSNDVDDPKNGGTWTFDGWYIDGDTTGTKYKYPDTVKMRTNGITFVGTWKFTPYPTNNLTITKKVEGRDSAFALDVNEIDYTFTVKGPTNVNGTYSDVTFTNGEATVIIKGEGSKTIEKLPVGEYTVIEQTPPDVTGYDFMGSTSDPTDGKVTLTNTDAGFVTITNQYKIKKLTVTVEKVVNGNMSDPSDTFTFTCGNDETFRLNGGNNSTKKIEVPYGSPFTVTESDKGGYTLESVSATNDQGAEIDNGWEITSVTENTTITFTNKKQINPPMGVITTIAPYAIMVVLAAGAGVYFVYSRRRHNG